MAIIKILHVSDTHGHNIDLRYPNIDILIHSGDGLLYGEMSEIKALNDMLATANARHIIYVPGNHDRAMEMFPVAVKDVNAKVLINEAINIMGLNIYGSPFTPTYGYWSFMRDRGSDIKKIWDNIPANTDILITHGPRYGVLDEVPRGHAGCEMLGEAVDRIKPKLHCFGHIHPGAGMVNINGVKYSNASVVSDDLDIIGWPNVIELEV